MSSATLRVAIRPQRGCLRFSRHESPQVSLSRRPKSAFEGHVAEIGVYKGRFLIALALSLSGDERAIAIDKFDSSDHVYETFKQNLTERGS
jgi:hypothetical protein